MVGMVQLVSAPDCGSGCRGFESHYPPFSYMDVAHALYVDMAMFLLRKA